MNPKVSVVLPVYNGVPYLEHSIESALRQSVKPHEIIVIDDGSTDDTPGTIRRFGDRILSRCIPNGGVANAMSLGMSLAGGDWIAFLDHDDVWFRNKLEKQLEAAARYPDAGFVCCNFAARPPGLCGKMVRHYSKLRCLRNFDFKRPLMKNTLRTLIGENFVGTSTVVLVKREITKKAGWFDPRFRISADYNYWLHCGLWTDFVVLEDVLLYKRTHRTNISADAAHTAAEHVQVLDAFLEKHRAGLSQRGLLKHCELERARSMYALGNLQYDRGKKGEAFGWFLRAMRSSRSGRNYGRFLFFFLKKLGRFLTFDLLSRKTLARGHR